MAHNPEVAGSNPDPATKMQFRGPFRTRRGPLSCGLCTAAYPGCAFAGSGRRSLTHPGEDRHAFGVLLRLAVLQPPEQQHHRQGQTTETIDEERGRLLMCPTSHSKFWP